MAEERATDMEHVAEDEPLKLAELKKGLSGLWAKTAQESASGTAAEIHVCTSNLIVHVYDDLSEVAAMEAVRVAADHHPLRAIIVRIEPEAKESTAEGAVSGYCQITRAGNLRVCCEQILVNVGGAAIEELPASVAGLMMQGLPGILWWIGRPPFDDLKFEHLQLLSDYLIVDSRDLAVFPYDLQRMAASLERHPQIAPFDLNWYRIDRWREMAADLFDEPDLQSFLFQIGKLSIRYAAGETPNPSQAILFAGWAGSRLGWSASKAESFHEGSEYRGEALARGAKICFEISPVESDLGGGEISEVRIETAKGDVDVRILRTADAIEASARMRTDEPREINKSSKYEPASLTDLLVGRLDSLWPDAVYRESLSTAVRLIATEVRDG